MISTAQRPSTERSTYNGTVYISTTRSEALALQREDYAHAVLAALVQRINTISNPVVARQEVRPQEQQVEKPKKLLKLRRTLGKVASWFKRSNATAEGKTSSARDMSLAQQWGELTVTPDVVVTATNRPARSLNLQPGDLTFLTRLNTLHATGRGSADPSAYTADRPRRPTSIHDPAARGAFAAMVIRARANDGVASARR